MLGSGWGKFMVMVRWWDHHTPCGKMLLGVCLTVRALADVCTLLSSILVRTAVCCIVYYVFTLNKQLFITECQDYLHVLLHVFS